MVSASQARTAEGPPITDETPGPRDRIVGDVIRGLYEERYGPGQRLTESFLTEEYGVSRGPVREALNRLSAMGVVELMPQRGAQIRLLSLEEAIDSLVVAQALVGVAARLAAERHGDKKGLARLEAALEEVARFDYSSPSADLAKARDKFYSALTGMAANSFLTRANMQLQTHLLRVQFRPVLQAAGKRRGRDYREIFEAVAAGNARRAETLARAHLGRSITALQQYMAR